MASRNEIEPVGTPKPSDRTIEHESALAELWRLTAEADQISEELACRLQAALHRCEGIELRGAEDLRAFKAVFDRASASAVSGPKLRDGRIGSLQIRVNRAGKAYTAFVAGRTCEYTGSAPNTIPAITLCRRL